MHIPQEHDCKLTQEIIELIDREADLLMRGVKETNLAGLRKRICTLFLQYIKTPTFNPEAAKYLKVGYVPIFLFCRLTSYEANTLIKLMVIILPSHETLLLSSPRFLISASIPLHNINLQVRVKIYTSLVCFYIPGNCPQLQIVSEIMFQEIQIFHRILVPLFLSFSSFQVLKKKIKDTKAYALRHTRYMMLVPYCYRPIST